MDKNEHKVLQQSEEFATKDERRWADQRKGKRIGLTKRCNTGFTYSPKF